MVATPIGNARDITLRALDVLEAADAIAAEDTRETLKLMRMHKVSTRGRPVVSYNDRNGPERRPRIMGWLREGLSVALCSDAGTPLIADPGYRLVEEAHAAGLPVTAVPGPSAVVTALTLTGLPSDRFLFAGFLPPRQGARRRALAALAAVPATLVLYESPRRLAAALADMAQVLGAERAGAVARELTKRFEEVRRGSLAELARHYAESGAPKGEVVLMAGPPSAAQPGGHGESGSIDAALREALATGSVRDAARDVAERLGLPRREVYARALALARR
ncbi:MAG TPA: 16S rRNA (cytidine(1402)-2'-O)-methyltransferase [Thermohalobaculum sp.]|nr:16S rRNA (cytidine(1402)-2'-O)-methyltransferase [Thermohalobaculum sp.]